MVISNSYVSLPEGKPHAHADLWVFRDLQDPFRSEFRGISSMQKFAPLGRDFFGLQRSSLGFNV